MDIPKTSDYSFTLTIPAHKQVKYNGKRIKYTYLNNKQQYRLCEDILQKLFLYDDNVDWVYEQHDDKRLHIHGYITNSYYEYLLEQIKGFYFDYRINIGLRTIFKIIDIQETQIDIGYWLKYCEKHQDEIIFKSRYRQEQDELAMLNGGATHKSQTPQFFKFDDCGLPIINKYPFGMVKIAPTSKKYIVEL